MSNVYGVTGMPLAGKTAVAELMQEHGFEVLDMGDVVRKEMEKRNIDTGEVGNFVNNQRDENGMDAIAQLSVDYLKDSLRQSERVVITGMRGWSEKECFEEELDLNIEIISVWASREIRKKRRLKRNREEDVKGQEFHERDLREISNGVGKLMALSDHMIKNDTTELEELEEQVENFVK